MADIPIKANKKQIVKPRNGIVQPPVMPPPDRVGRNTNQLKFLFTLVNEMLKLKMSEPFREPIDAKTLKLPNYHKIIKQPMDLGTIKKRLENQFYWSSQEAIKDFETIFLNCTTYNKSDEQMIKAAHALKKKFDKKIEKMPEIEEELPVSRRRKTDLNTTQKQKTDLNKTQRQKTDLNKTQKPNTVSFAPVATIFGSPKKKKGTKYPKNIVSTSPIPNTPDGPEAIQTIEGRLQDPTKRPAKRVRSKIVTSEEPQQHVTEHVPEATSPAETVTDNSNGPSTESPGHITERRKTALPKKSRRKAIKTSAELAASSEPAASSGTVANGNVENSKGIPNTELENVEHEPNAEALPTSTIETITDSNRQQNLIQSNSLGDAEAKIRMKKLEDKVSMLRLELQRLAQFIKTAFDSACSNGKYCLMTF